MHSAPSTRTRLLHAMEAYACLLQPNVFFHDARGHASDVRFRSCVGVKRHTLARAEGGSGPSEDRLARVAITVGDDCKVCVCVCLRSVCGCKVWACGFQLLVWVCVSVGCVCVFVRACVRACVCARVQALCECHAF